MREGRSHRFDGINLVGFRQGLHEFAGSIRILQQPVRERTPHRFGSHGVVRRQITAQRVAASGSVRAQAEAIPTTASFRAESTSRPSAQWMAASGSEAAMVLREMSGGSILVRALGHLRDVLAGILRTLRAPQIEHVVQSQSPQFTLR